MLNRRGRGNTWYSSSLIVVPDSSSQAGKVVGWKAARLFRACGNRGISQGGTCRGRTCRMAGPGGAGRYLTNLYLGYSPSLVVVVVAGGGSCITSILFKAGRPYMHMHPSKTTSETRFEPKVLKILKQARAAVDRARSNHTHTYIYIYNAVCRYNRETPAFNAF